VSGVSSDADNLVERRGLSGTTSNDVDLGGGGGLSDCGRGDQDL
jgi:hypothetical protein